jgi:hypothetical protein
MPARPSETTREVFYSVGGLTARPDAKKDVHLRWKSVAPLAIGDVVHVKVLEVKRADPAKSRIKAVRKGK